jgi:hypothetical protein
VEAWEYHHKADCKILAQLEKLGETLRATIHLLKNQRAGNIDDSEWSAFMSLESTWKIMFRKKILFREQWQKLQPGRIDQNQLICSRKHNARYFQGTWNKIRN